MSEVLGPKNLSWLDKPDHAEQDVDPLLLGFAKGKLEQIFAHLKREDDERWTYEPDALKNNVEFEEWWTDISEETGSERTMLSLALRETLEQTHYCVDVQFMSQDAVFSAREETEIAVLRYELKVSKQTGEVDGASYDLIMMADSPSRDPKADQPLVPQDRSSIAGISKVAKEFGNYQLTSLNMVLNEAASLIY